MTDKILSAEQLQIDTLRYYETHAVSLIETSQPPPSAEEWYQPFLSLLLPNAHMLDAGCGAGYASQYFIQHGFTVTAFDATEVLVQFSSVLLQQPVHHLKYEDIEFENEFDGIWACASLLHVPRLHMTQVIHKLAVALKENGVFYANFVYGKSETSRGGILFNDYTEEELQIALATEPSLQLLQIWRSPDLPPARAGREWIHVLLRKVSSLYNNVSAA